MRTTFRTTLGRAFRRTALPLACYYAVTLAVPLANGAAYAGSAFVVHALVVLVMPPVMIGLACAIHTGGRAVLGCCDSARRLLGRSALP
jgi:ABC-type molybdate transport system permease subunit